MVVLVNSVLTIVSMVIGIYFIHKSLSFYTHMFQLNSYVPKTQLKWIKNNYRSKSPLLHKIDQAKKPLVVTPRVKRLYITFSVIALIFTLCVNAILVKYLLGNLYFLTVSISLFFLYFLTPFFILLANFINKPIEKRLNNYYINDAKRILSESEDLKVIGITGSFGKTSTKFFLNSLLQCEYETLMTPQNFNTTLGVVKTIREDLRPTHEIFVCEMGARNVNDIKEICDIVHPEIGIITSIGEQHLESFKSIDNIINTKFELVDALPEDGLAFLNYDNEYIRNKKIDKPFKTYSLDNESDYKAKDIKFTNDGTMFTVVLDDGREQRFQTKLMGLHNILNITACIGLCYSLGITLEKLVVAVKKLESVPHRLELRKSGGITIIDDAYNSNPNGAKTALDCLSNFEGKKILITPGMVELGEREYELNKEFGAYATNKTDEVLLIGKDRTIPIYEGLVENGFNKDKIRVFNSFDTAFSYCTQLKNYTDKVTVLIENDLPDNY